MVRWSPSTRKEFIRKLKKPGFDSPEPGGRRYYMRLGAYGFIYRFVFPLVQQETELNRTRCLFILVAKTAL
jgi:hypothetical protein